jgi:asparagine synthase (glutamine-hydrolysing)
MNIYEIESFNQDTQLKCDLAGHNPIYIYLSPDLTFILESTDITEILNSSKLKSALQISKEGLSFLLQSSLVPPPQTIYENLFVIEVGHSVAISKKSNNKFQLNFSYAFPFYAKNRDTKLVQNIDYDHFINQFTQEIDKVLPSNKNIYLFHSAGKDSNTIALALQKSKFKERIKFVTHKSTGNNDETHECLKVSKKLGFEHIILDEVKEIKKENYPQIIEYFKELPLPSTDNVTMALSLYKSLFSELEDSTIITGDGNDVYMGIPASKRESLFFKLSPLLSLFKVIFKNLRSENPLNIVMKSKAEWCQMEGFTAKESQKLINYSLDAHKYWTELSHQKKSLDELDFKTEVMSGIRASRVHVQKMRLAAIAWKANHILPFMIPTIASYFAKMPEKYLIDRKQRKNKLFLRELLKKKLDLDSDKIGKKGYNFNTYKFINSNWDWIEKETYKCSEWNHEQIKRTLNRLKANCGPKSTQERFATRLVYRLFVLSMWINHSKYLDRSTLYLPK